MPGPRMVAAAVTVALLAAATLCLPPPAGAFTIYQKVDERGVIHLSNVPQRGSGVTKIQITSWSKPRRSSTPVSSEAREAIRQLVRELAAEYEVDPDLAEAVARIESGFNPRALSPKGAMGVMQLIPDTAERFGVEDAYDAEANIRGGLAYLAWLLGEFENDTRRALAAYNCGENRVRRCKDIPDIRETRDYVEAVTAVMNGRPIPPRGSSSRIVQRVDANGVLHLSNVRR